jgi:UDP-galactopyranose mutase
MYDLIVAGAGPVGSVVAERAASQLDWKVLLIDKRHHLAGNCFDDYHSSGILIHRYGPHYFRTNDDGLLRYLSQFSEWIPGNFIVKSLVRDTYFPFPINLTTLEQFYGLKNLTPELGAQLLKKIQEPIESPRNSEEFVLSRVGRELYEAFYLGYTLKQWSRHPKDLEPSVCGRIPIRLNRDDRYVDHRHQLTPRNGFAELFRRMVQHPNIHIMLNTDYREIRNLYTARKATLYTGPIDEYFDNRLGKLTWRSLRFEYQELNREYAQPCVQINYPNDHLYTRSVEIKHITGQKAPHTVVTYEYPESRGEPFYPIPALESTNLYARYKILAEQEEKNRQVYFAGRLAQYTYINTDQAIEIGLKTFERIRDRQLFKAE